MSATRTLPSLELPAIAELAQRRQWVLWKYEKHGEDLTKVPYTVSGPRASTTDPTTWNTFDMCAQAFVEGRGDGLGYVFDGGDPYFGVDLDKCIDDDGRPSDKAIEIVLKLNSYTEVSPSGRGLHIIARGGLPPGWRNGNGLEAYARLRYFTVTGDLWPDGLETIEERTAEIAALQQPATPREPLPGRGKRFAPGERHEALVRRATALRKKGLIPAELLAALQVYNLERCDPPKSEQEVRSIIEWTERLPEKSSPIIIRMASVEPEKVEWLWHPYMPRGKLILLEGDPGLGKSWFAVMLAAKVSRGFSPPPTNSVQPQPLEAANVLIAVAEDGIADTVRGRLDAAEADVSRIFVLDGLLREDGERKDWTLADLGPLEESLARTRPTLMVLDPIQAYLGAGVDMHRANEVRPLLAGLGRLAEQYHTTVLAIRHLRKSSSDRAVYRGLGSIDFSAAVRSILLVGEDPENAGRRVVAHSKSNLAPLGGSMAFEIREGAFQWCGGSPLSADDLLAVREPAEKRASREEAEEFLESILANAPVASDEILKQGKKAGFSRSTLYRAKAQLGIRARRKGFGPEGSWTWEWPIDDLADDEGLEV